MSRLHSDDKNKVRNYSNVSHNYAEIESRRKNEAIQKVVKEASVEYKMFDARNKCIQPLHHLEKEWKKAVKEKNSKKFEEARFNFLRGLDKAAADYMGRIMAEIKQACLIKKGICKDELLRVNLSVEDFYAGFKKFCKRELKDYSITEDEFIGILTWQFERNIEIFKKYEKLFGYNKVIKQFNKNLEYIKDISVVENELKV